MAADIHVLPTRLVSDKLSIIEQLNYLLDRAQAGELQAFGYALLTSNGAIDAGCSDTDQGPAMLGAASLLHSRLLKAIDGDQL